ncbi:MAG: DUF4230 domain-containing protein [Gallionella sp.]|nr:DUF4230 domain-containing protein [Gallionella sp.]MDD4945654.1 DUF4230 domain-containing protein [Gallionella sp.]
MTKFLSLFFSLVGAVAIGVLGMWAFGKRTTPLPPQPPLMSLENMGHLVTVKVNYVDVLPYAELITKDIPGTKWELRFGGTKVLLVVRGDCLVGTDVRLAKYLEVNNDLRTAVLVLREPKAISARVKHDRKEQGGSYSYEVTDTGIALIPGSDNRTKATDKAWVVAQQSISQYCSSPEVIATARKNAVVTLLPLLSAIGWKVNIRWVQ